MAVNIILRVLKAPFDFLLLIPAIITTNLIGLLIAIPGIDIIYVFIMNIIWLPFYGFIFGVSWLYKKVPILGIPLSLIGIPIVIIIDTFLSFMPNPEREDKYNKATICDSYPFSMPSQLSGKLIPISEPEQLEETKPKIR